MVVQGTKRTPKSTKINILFKGDYTSHHYDAVKNAGWHLKRGDVLTVHGVEI
jgi:hypothetical protein